MKKSAHNLSVYKMLFVVFVLTTSCGNSSEETAKDMNNESTKSEQKSESKSENIDGVYIGSRSISGLELVAKLIVSGNSWSATSHLGYDSPEFQNGVVKGKDLYDESGMIKIGYVNGMNAHINGYPTMSLSN